MSLLFFLTRLEPGDDLLATMASSMGFTVLRVPLLVTEPGSDAPALASRLDRIEDGTAIAWTSRRAAEALAAALRGKIGKLESVPMFALGEESAAPVRRAGLAPITPKEGLGAVALAKLILEQAPVRRIRRALVLRGDRSLADLPTRLGTGGIEVEPMEVYRTRFVNGDVSGFTSWIRTGDPIAVVFFSPSGVLALERLLDPEALRLTRERVTAVARGDTTARTLDELGYRSVFRPQESTGFEGVILEALRNTSGASR